MENIFESSVGELKHDATREEGGDHARCKIRTVFHFCGRGVYRAFRRGGAQWSGIDHLHQIPGAADTIRIAASANEEPTAIFFIKSLCPGASIISTSY